MHVATEGGRQPPLSDFLVHVGDEPALGRLPLRQPWQLVGASVIPLPAECERPAVRGRSKFAVVARGSQGEIWALNERALSQGRQAVTAAHPGQVRFGEPRIHAYLDPHRQLPMEPLMAVKVNARREHLEPVLRELRARGRMQEVELQRGKVVLRAQVRLAALLGFEDVARAISVDSAQVFSWLIRYEATAALLATGTKE